MKKLVSFKISALVIAMFACCMTFSACSDDDPEPSNGLENIKVEYLVSLSENWYKYFDIEVTYTGVGSVERLELTNDWAFNFEIPYSAEPEEFACNVIATPKADAPAIVSTETYLMVEDIKAQVSGIKQNGEIDINYGLKGTRNGNDDKTAKEMENFLKRSYTLLSFLFIPEK